MYWDLDKLVGDTTLHFMYHREREWQGDSLTHLMNITVLLLFWSIGHTKFGNKKESQSLADHQVGLSNLPIRE